MKPALIVIDIQNVWLDDNKELKTSVERRLEVINAAIGWFRRKGLPIIAVYHEAKDKGAVPGARPFEFPKSVGIKETDFRVTKHYPNAFNKTELETIVRREGCDTVVITGLSASGCALATYFGAIDHDLDPYLVQGGVASHDDGHVRCAESICATLSVGEFEKTLR